MSDKNHHKNAVPTYIITALVLAVITYIEFAIVEYEIAWLSDGATLFWLILLSVAKFLMVVGIFMHLKDDEATYSGFFTSGMILAVATFIILPLLFTVNSMPPTMRMETADHGEVHAESGLSEEERELIESDGASRDGAAALDTPRPMDRSLAIDPPAAEDPQATLRAPESEPQTEEEGDGAAAQAGDEEQADAQDEAGSGEDGPAGVGEAGEEFNREAGQTVYSQNCQSCHQATGGGLPGVFPPLAGNMPDLYNAEGGREYLIDVLLHGLTGQIEVDGQTYNGVMPPWPQLSDEQIASVLNHELTAWGNEEELVDFAPITSDEVAGRRGQDGGDMNARRSELFQ